MKLLHHYEFHFFKLHKFLHRSRNLMKYYAHHTLFFWGEGIVIKRNHNYLYQYLLILIPCLYLYIKWVKSRLRNFSKFSRFLWGITLFSHFSREIDVIKTDQMLSNYLQSGKLDKRLCNFPYDWTDHDKARKIWLNWEI